MLLQPLCLFPRQPGGWGGGYSAVLSPAWCYVPPTFSDAYAVFPDMCWNAMFALLAGPFGYAVVRRLPLPNSTASRPLLGRLLFLLVQLIRSLPGSKATRQDAERPGLAGSAA